MLKGMKTKYPGITCDEKAKTYTAKHKCKEYSPKNRSLPNLLFDSEIR